MLAVHAMFMAADSLLSAPSLPIPPSSWHVSVRHPAPCSCHVGCETGRSARPHAKTGEL